MLVVFLSINISVINHVGYILSINITVINHVGCIFLKLCFKSCCFLFNAITVL